MAYVAWRYILFTTHLFFRFALLFVYVAALVSALVLFIVGRVQTFRRRGRRSSENLGSWKRRSSSSSSSPSPRGRRFRGGGNRSRSGSRDSLHYSKLVWKSRPLHAVTTWNCPTGVQAQQTLAIHPEPFEKPTLTSHHYLNEYSLCLTIPICVLLLPSVLLCHLPLW